MSTKLSKKEEQIQQNIINKFSIEQICVFFLTKTIQNIYQFEDNFVLNWYLETFGEKPNNQDLFRPKLVEAYTRMLLIENKYQNHLNYWIKLKQNQLLKEMELFFSSKDAKKS